MYVAQTQVQVLVDPSQRNYLYCSCVAADGEPMLWSPGQGLCVNMRSSQVIFDAAIVSDALRLSIAPGFYPLLAEPGFVPGDWRAFLTSASLNNSLRVVPCRLADACSSSNVPSSLPLPAIYSFHFECGAGRDPASLMCSRCMTGYFSTGATCTHCFPGASVVAVLMSLILGCTILVLVWRLNPRSHSALFAISFFYLQVTEALEQSFTDAGFLVSTLPTNIIAMLYLRPFALECLTNGADSVTAMWTWLFVLLAIPLATAVMGWVTKRWCAPAALSAERVAAEVRSRIAACTWQLYALVYLPVARASLSAYARETAANSMVFVSSAPYMPWYGERHRVWLALATVILVVFLVPFLLAGFIRGWRVKKSHDPDQKMHESELPPPLLVLRKWERMWWWASVVVDGRRFFFALIISLSPWRSEWLPIVAVFALLVLLSATLVLRPYREPRENWYEAALLFTALVLYTGQLSSELSDTQSTATNAFIAVSVLVVKLSVIALVLFQAGSRLCAKWSLRSASTSRKPTPAVLAQPQIADAYRKLEDEGEHDRARALL
jgi:hypothetical protein